METTNKTFLQKLAEVWAIVYTACHFIPLISSLAWIIYYTMNPSNFVVNYILFPLMVIGWVAATIARFPAFLSLMGKCVGMGTSIGFIFIFPFNLAFMLVGMAFGLALAGGIAIYAPAVVTIFCFVKDLFVDKED